MVASRQPSTDRLRRAISEQDAAVVPEHRVPHCRFNADARRASSKDQALDSETAEFFIQVGSIKPAIPMLGDDEVFRRRP
jgi:hypothetical protein